MLVNSHLRARSIPVLRHQPAFSALFNLNRVAFLIATSHSHSPYLYKPSKPPARPCLHTPASACQASIPTSKPFKSHRVRRASGFLQVAVSKAPQHTKIVLPTHIGALPIQP